MTDYEFYIKGDVKSQILFLKDSTSPVEKLRGELFVNEERVLLQKYILDPLGLKRENVMLGVCQDKAKLDQFLKAAQVKCAVSLSRLLRFEKERGYWNFPELWDIAEREERFAPELARKCVTIKKILDNTKSLPVCSVSLVAKGALPTRAANDSNLAPIKKAKPSLQIVYGVVLDPYTVDAHNDWIPPADIEATAIKFMKEYRSITLQHEEAAPDAVLVENFVEPYPTENDRARAHANETHKAYARMYGDDRIHSGAWVIGVQLSDRLWKQYERGEIGAFSIEGFGYRENVTTAQMPKVTYVELGEVGVTVGQEDPKARLT